MRTCRPPALVEVDGTAPRSVCIPCITIDLNEVQLELTPAAQPRVLVRARATDEDRNDFFYAACDQFCTEPAQWSFIYLTSNRGTAPFEFNDDSLPRGTVRLAYDATYYARCIYIPETGEWKPWQVFNLVWRTVRVKSFG